MLFLVKQTHASDHCPKDRGGSTTLYDAGASGVKLERVLGDYARHTIYYLLEADRLEAVQNFLDPGWVHCTSEITPVAEEPIGR